MSAGDDPDDFPECQKCGHDYELRGEQEPTKYCDQCAHEVVSQQEKELSARDAEIARLREALALAHGQLVKCRKFLPKHGSFGEDGIDAYEHATEQAKQALSQPQPSKDLEG